MVKQPLTLKTLVILYALAPSWQLSPGMDKVLAMVFTASQRDPPAAVGLEVPKCTKGKQPPPRPKRNGCGCLFVIYQIIYSQVVKMGSTKYAREFVQLTTELRLWP